LAEAAHSLHTAVQRHLDLPEKFLLEGRLLSLNVTSLLDEGHVREAFPSPLPLVRHVVPDQGDVPPGSQ